MTQPSLEAPAAHDPSEPPQELDADTCRELENSFLKTPASPLFFPARPPATSNPESPSPTAILRPPCTAAGSRQIVIHVTWGKSLSTALLSSDCYPHHIALAVPLAPEVLSQCWEWIF